MDGARQKTYIRHLREMYRQGHNPLRWVFDASVDASLLLATNGDVYASSAPSPTTCGRGPKQNVDARIPS